MALGLIEGVLLSGLVAIEGDIETQLDVEQSQKHSQQAIDAKGERGEGSESCRPVSVPS